MNERIKELAKQAEITLVLTEYTGCLSGQEFLVTDRNLTNIHLEKFAELIVRECVKVMYDNAIERKVGLDIDKRPTYYAAAILEHFGAKE